jgi:hypothetical protein
MDDKQFKELSAKMDTLVKLLALNTVKDKELKEQVITLSSAGFQTKEISEALGQKYKTVETILYWFRKAEREQEGASKKQEEKGNEKQITKVKSE